MFSLMPNMPKCEKQLEHKWKMEIKCMEVTTLNLETTTVNYNVK